MRVALNGYFWGQPRTGSGQYLRHLWEALPEVIEQQGAPPDFTMLLPPGEPGGAVPTAPGFRVRHGRRVVAGPLAISGRSGNLDKLLWEERGVSGEARRAGAGLLHSPYLSAPVRKRLPTIVTAHDMIPWVVPGYQGSPAFRLYLRLATAGVKRADLILADSEASRRDVIKVLRVPPERVRTVYLGMEAHPNFTLAEMEEVCARHGLPGAFKYAFYLGGFDSRKNVPLLLRAWRDVVDSLAGKGGETPLLAVGGAVPQPGGVFPDIMAEARALGFGGPDSPVRFIGRISEEDKPRLMAAARLFVYPSAYEGFGLDPLEAMSVGCPVVSSSGGSLREVVGSGGFLVPPGNQAALTGAVIEVWRSLLMREAVARGGIFQARRFTWRSTAEQTLAAYREVLGRRNRQDAEYAKVAPR